MRVSRSKSRRRRVGRVTVYQRGGHFWLYYRQGGAGDPPGGGERPR